MSCLFKYILYLYQFYSIFFGFSYAFVNIEKRLVKFYTLVKIYVTFINIIYTVILIFFIIKNSEGILLHLTGNNSVKEIIFITQNFTRLYLIIGLFVLRFKEEKAFKEIYLWQIKYIDQRSHSSDNDKFTEIIQSSYIIILFIHGYMTVNGIVSNVIYGAWMHLILHVSFNIFMAMELNVIFHHCLILTYINNLFCKINYQLENEVIPEMLNNIYFKISMLLKYVNNINGPFILAVLLSQTLAIVFYINTINLLIRQTQIYLHGGLTFSILLLLISFNIVLYFLMCDRFCSTICKTGEILKEYIAKIQNSEVISYILCTVK